MRPLLWLASYPKSGNTWFRILLANLTAPEPVDINNLPERGGIASSRAMFDDITMLPSAMLKHAECDRLRPSVYAALAEGQDANLSSSGDRNSTGRPRFFKTHDAYTITETGDPLLGRSVAIGALLLVRDPRDVTMSLAHHSGRTIDQTIEFMADPAGSFDGSLDRLGKHLRQQLPGWSRYHQTWLAQAEVPVHVVRYEDLHTSPLDTLAAALAFAGVAANAADIERAWQFSSFRNLQDQERRAGFKERSRANPGAFFRRGMAGGWRDELSALQAELILLQHQEMMMKFGYCEGTS